jgi:N-acetylmuramoyl-L-alanine amidase
VNFVEIYFPERAPVVLRIDSINSIVWDAERGGTYDKLTISVTGWSGPLIHQGPDCGFIYNKLKGLLGWTTIKRDQTDELLSGTTMTRPTGAAEIGESLKPEDVFSVNGHGSSNAVSKPPIKAFIPSPNHSSRNGAVIEVIVLHCTECSLDVTLSEFQNQGGNQVSAHYVIDRNGDIYQMVADSDRANHCMGANQNSIGIEHVGSETDTLAPEQQNASASLIRWLVGQYNIPKTSIYGHDFTPGYNRPGGTSCPDKLFGVVHNQNTIAAWVAANV